METEGYGSCLILFRADLNWGRNDGGDTLNKIDVYKIVRFEERHPYILNIISDFVMPILID